MKVDNKDKVSIGKKCFTPDCGEDAHWKCLCKSCYGQAKKLIDAEETTWEELCDLGLAMLPAQRFRQEFFKRKREMEKPKLVPEDVRAFAGETL